MVAWRWLKWTVLALAGALALLIFAGVVYQGIGINADAQRFPPPGQLVVVGENRLHLNCTGEGSPTIVLEALSGGMSSYWAWVQPRLAEVTQVCSYDRLGRGWSDHDAPQQDLWQTAATLRGLLENAGVAGPYVLVGHSVGGLYVRAFADQHPEDVAGLVLVDAAHPQQFQRAPEIAGENESFLRLTSIFPALARVGLFRFYFARGGEIDFAGLPPEAHDVVAAFWSTPDYFRSQRAEVLAGPLIFEQAQDLPSDLGDLPLVVVTASGDLATIWMELQSELATLSADSTHVTLPDTTHVSLIFNQEHAEQLSSEIVGLLERIRRTAGQGSQ